LLRARLEAAWLGPGAASQTAEQLLASLQAASQGVKPDVVASVALPVFAAASPEVQTRLDSALPAWLARQDDLSTLEALVQRARLTGAPKAIALRWLAAGGREVSQLVPSAESTFHSAYALDYEWQAAVVVIWYSNAQRTRARGMQILIDRNPPWNGALKDAFLFPNKPPEALIEHYVDMWASRGHAMKPLTAPEAKRKLVLALKDNEAAGVRLPKDFVALREPFIEHVLGLPDAPDTPAFTLADFQALSEHGQSAESIAHFEQTVARRVLMDDGQELYIDASLANEDFGDWDEESAE
jgi:hypothetical protein